MHSTVLEEGYVKGHYSLHIHVFDGRDMTVRPCGISKVMSNLILGECAHTFTNINSTWKDIVEAGDLTMKLPTDRNGIDN